MMSNFYDVCILGSGPAGLTSALYGAQSGYNILLLTGTELGGKLTQIANLTNYPGYSSISGTDLFNNMINQIQQYSNVTIVFDSATNIIYDKGEYFIESEYSGIFKSKSLISAIGLKPRLLNIESEKKFINNGISFCALCDGPFYKDKNVLVIGGGNSAMEYALTLSNYCKEIQIIHRRDQLRASSNMINKVLKQKNIKIIFNTNVLEIKKENVRNTFELVTNNDLITNVHGIFYALGFDKIKLPINYENPNQLLNFIEAGDCTTNIHQVITACSSGCEAVLKIINGLR